MDSSLNQLTYEKFKKDILTLELKPGDTVSAAKIADRYSVSRTPAREALVKLEAEGMVDIIPQSKSVISRIDLDKAAQEWFIRSSLEIAMVDRFFERVTKEDIAKMKSCNARMQSLSKKKKSQEVNYQYQLADNDFHLVTYEASGEKLAAAVIATNMAHYSRLRFLTDSDIEYRERTMNGHEELIRLLEERDIKGYKKALKIHLGHIVNDIADFEKMYPNYFAEKTN